MKRPLGLGRGLGALIEESNRPRDGESSGVRDIDVASIRPNPDQPRKQFDEEALADLAASIKARGVLQPILLRAVGDGYEIVAGERRWRAAQRAQLHRIPAIVRDLDDESTAEVALIENIQRADLNAIEEADAYQQLIDRHGHTQDAVGKLVGKSRSHVTNLLRLLGLPGDVRDMLLRGDISMGHARAVVGADDPSALAKDIVENGLTVRQAEARAKGAKPKQRVETKATAPVDADLAALERQLGDMLGLKVRVAHGRGGGTVTLSYASLDQLDMICQRLSGEPI
ncbi:ParB/RepB/Spo0J family partition protein [Sphingomonas sp. ASV193]|uniref:ParB/RepB/Spo0J family partition protein n=1 Tax=Sphingomonas sp. ASV193 TaxID=3144405 RepID=UPI0032E8B6F9